MTFWELGSALFGIRVILRGKLGFYGRSDVFEKWFRRRDEKWGTTRFAVQTSRSGNTDNVCLSCHIGNCFHTSCILYCLTSLLRGIMILYHVMWRLLPDLYFWPLLFCAIVGIMVLGIPPPLHTIFVSSDFRLLTTATPYMSSAMQLIVSWRGGLHHQ